MSAKALYGFACGLVGGGLRSVVQRVLSADDAPSAVRFSGTWVRYDDGSEWITIRIAAGDVRRVAVITSSEFEALIEATGIRPTGR